MTVRVRMKKIWVANDGREFTNELAAIEHQRFLQMKSVLSDFDEHEIKSVIARWDRLEAAMIVETVDHSEV